MGGVTRLLQDRCTGQCAAPAARQASLAAIWSVRTPSRPEPATAKAYVPGMSPSMVARAKVLTSAQVARLKPNVVVRERSDVRRSLIVWATLYLLAFHAVVFLWRWRGTPGDRVLLIATHLLTAIGFAAMLGRPDPLRDVLLRFDRAL